MRVNVWTGIDVLYTLVCIFRTGHILSTFCPTFVLRIGCDSMVFFGQGIFLADIYIPYVSRDLFTIFQAAVKSDISLSVSSPATSSKNYNLYYW